MICGWWVVGGGRREFRMCSSWVVGCLWWEEGGWRGNRPGGRFVEVLCQLVLLSVGKVRMNTAVTIRYSFLCLHDHE